MKKESAPQVTAVMPCNCNGTKGAIQQDKMYGVGMRIHNERVAKRKPVGYTCTVCGTRKN